MFVVWLIVEVTEEASTTDLVQPSGFQWFFVDLLDNFTYVRLLARQASLPSAAGCAAAPACLSLMSRYFLIGNI